MSMLDFDGKVSNVTPKFKWVIDNFSQRDSKVGLSSGFSSPIFTTTCDNVSTRWKMMLYPIKKTLLNEDQFRITLHATDKFCKAIASCQILDSKGETAMISTKDIECIFEPRGREWLISRKYVLDPANDILNDDKLTIVCKLSWHDKEVEYVSFRLVEMDKYEALINDDKFSDTALISKGKAVKVHKCILAKSSPVFAAMFDADMSEKKNNTVEIEDIEHDVLLEMIRFVYAGKVKDIDAIAGELAAAADKYDINELKDMCEKTMCKNLTIGNVLSSLELADRHRMDKLKKKGTEFIVAHANDVTNQPGFNLLPSVLLGDICRALVISNK